MLFFKAITIFSLATLTTSCGTRTRIIAPYAAVYVELERIQQIKEKNGPYQYGLSQVPYRGFHFVKKETTPNSATFIRQRPYIGVRHVETIKIKRTRDPGRTKVHVKDDSSATLFCYFFFPPAIAFAPLDLLFTDPQGEKEIVAALRNSVQSDRIDFHAELLRIRTHPPKK